MKLPFRKLISWMLAASMLVGMSLSAAPALADEVEPGDGPSIADELIEDEPGDENPIEADPIIDEGELAEVDLTATVPDPEEEPQFSLMDIVVPGSATKEQLAMKIVGQLINNQNNRLRNITYSGGTPASSGTFTGGQDIIRLAEGAVFTSGKAVDVGSNPNHPYSHDSGSGGDSILTDILASTEATTNKSVLEFEFRPVQDGTISFDYVFGSKEYGRGTKNKDRNNDGFYFLFGEASKKLNSSHNIARVKIGSKENQVVSVYNINETTPDLFIANPASGGKKVALNGFTKVLTTKDVSVKKDQWYKIRIAIADAYDDDDRDDLRKYAWKYDSAVFIGAGSYQDNQGPKWPKNAAIDVAEQCGIVTLSWPEATDSSTPVQYEVKVNGESQPRTEQRTVTLPLAPGPYEFKVIPWDAKGNPGNALTKNHTVTSTSSGGDGIGWDTPDHVSNGESFYIRFAKGGCVGGDFDETVALKVREKDTNKLIAGYVYNQSISYDAQTGYYSQLFDTSRFNVKDTVLKIFVYFGSKLRAAWDVIVGSP